MSGFTGYIGTGGGGGGACAAAGVSGNVEVASQAQVDQRVAVGVLCPLFIGPDQNRLKIVTVGNGLQFLNFLNGAGVGVIPNDAGSRAVDWQAFRTAATQIASAYYTTAVGQSNTVDSTNSLAVGYHNTVYAGYTRAIAIGSENLVSANEALAVGYNNNIGAGASYAVAIGRNITVNAGVTGAVAIGSGASAGGNSCVAVGLTASAQAYGTAVGNATTAYLGATAVGGLTTASGSYSLALGNLATVSPGATYGVAVGYSTLAAVASATALGDRAVNRITKTHNISGPSLIRKDNGELLANALQFFSGDNFYILTPEIDFTALAADYDFAVPIGASFWVEEVGVIVSTLGGAVVTQPTVQFGITGTPAKWLAPTLCTLLTALRKRERFTLLLTDDGETSMSFGVTVPGAVAAGSYLGRAFFRGMLVEDQ